MQRARECDGSVAHATKCLKGMSLPKSKLAIANDKSKAMMSVESLAVSDIRPSLRVDVSYITVDSNLPSSAFSSLTPPLSTPVLFPSATINPIDPEHNLVQSSENYSQLNTSPSPPVMLVRPSLRRSHFSSFRGESVPESDPLHLGEEVATDAKDDARLAACRGWQIAQRLREAALSDWESQRVIKPTLPVSKCTISIRNISSRHGSLTRNGLHVSPQPI